MTLAVCIACGAQKIGAFTPCPVCAHDPAGEDLEHEARSLTLTDHYLSPEQLEAASAAIKAGATPTYDEAAVREIVAHATGQGQTTLVGSTRGCSIAVLAVAVALGLAIGLVSYLLRL